MTTLTYTKALTPLMQISLQVLARFGATPQEALAFIKGLDRMQQVKLNLLAVPENQRRIGPAWNTSVSWLQGRLEKIRSSPVMLIGIDTEAPWIKRIWDQYGTRRCVACGAAVEVIHWGERCPDCLGELIDSSVAQLGIVQSAE